MCPEIRTRLLSASSPHAGVALILHDRLPIADVVNAKVISLEDAVDGYESFDQGDATKYVLYPHGDVAKAAWR